MYAFLFLLSLFCTQDGPKRSKYAVQIPPPFGGGRCTFFLVAKKTKYQGWITSESPYISTP